VIGSGGLAASPPHHGRIRYYLMKIPDFYLAVIVGRGGA
jgi:hypothetical protein